MKECKFKIGKYYVLLELTPLKGTQFEGKLLINHIYISSISNNTLFRTRLDSKNNKNTIIHHSAILQYREATMSEIKRYRKVKQPFDVTDTAWIMENIENNLNLLEAKLQENE